ncbi:MAG: helix-turn-helix domain-containing protein [Proteobacteria bacterium]|jgi:hypothetical protein|nr:helix-turn-helix domain-containing protein [Pseudomonadota bacterium]
MSKLTNQPEIITPTNDDPQKPRPLGINDVIAAIFLGVQPTTLRKWRSEGKGPVFYKIGRKVQYTLKDLQDFHAQQAVSR